MSHVAFQLRQVKNWFVWSVKAVCQFGEICECEYVFLWGGVGGMHGDTGAKLGSETSQIACEMKQTTPEEKNKTKQQQQHKAPEKWQARKAGTEAEMKKNQNQTNTPFFQLDIFQTADDKTTLKELEESKSNRQVCLTVSWIRVEAEAPHHIKPCKFSWKPPLPL